MVIEKKDSFGSLGNEIDHSLCFWQMAHGKKWDSLYGNSIFLTISEFAKSEALDDLYQQYGDSFKNGFDSLVKNTNLVKGTTFYRVMSIIYNNDLPEDTPPLCKISYLGYSGDGRNFLNVEQLIAMINKGDYNN